MLNVRRSNDRGFAQHGWLTSRHTFSFASYFDRAHMGFGPLRVINEDWIEGGTGFGAHPHNDMEIVTYVVAGSLAHKDSLGNSSEIRPNEVQRMTAGKGIVHSEVNPNEGVETHLFQIWIKPKELGLTPGYGQKDFGDAIASAEPTLVVSNDGRNGSISINQDLDLYITRFKEERSYEFDIAKGRGAWIQVAKGSVNVNGKVLETGDALAVTDESKVLVEGGAGAEFLLFDMKMDYK